jgi:hypothetical protein
MEEIKMKRVFKGFTLLLFPLLFIGISSGGFVNEPTVWNDPNFTGVNGTYICPFCNIGSYNFTDFLSPKIAVEKPVIEPEKPIPVVIPGFAPITNPDIASLIASLSKKQALVPSGRLPIIF